MPKKPLPQMERGQIERDLLKMGRILAGVDEVGRGCLAGPVVAACAVLDYEKVDQLAPAMRSLLRDSKTLSASQRQSMLPIIEGVSLDCHHAFASVEEVERLGIVHATFLAMRRAISKCSNSFDLLLVDGKQPLAGHDGEQLNIVKGDNLCYAIAAAAIVAKEARDRYMQEQSEIYPAYGFQAHVGYGTRQHLSMIEAHGICKIHRRNFEPIRSLIHADNKPHSSTAAIP
jgi:ribonuclease HII